MKKIVYYGFILFIVSLMVGYYFGSVWKSNNNDLALEDEINENNIKNQNVIETIEEEEKVSYNAKYIEKEYFDECGHFKEEEKKLPQELINLTREEVEDLYEDVEVETFSPDLVILSKEINNICDEHFVVKKGENNIEIYQIGNGGALELYKETNISNEYLTEEDLERLGEGIIVYGKGKLNSIIEDFE